MKLEDLNDEELKKLERYFKYNLIGHYIGFSFLGLFLFTLIIMALTI